VEFPLLWNVASARERDVMRNSSGGPEYLRIL